MDTVFQFLFQFLGQFFGSIFNGFVTMLGAFNIPEYISIITRYANTLGGLAWVVAIIATLLLVAVFVFIILLIVKSVRKSIKNRQARKDAGSLVKEVQALNREVMRLNLEKDKILSMKVSQIGLNPNEISELTGEEIETLNKGEKQRATRIPAESASSSSHSSTSFGRIISRLSTTTISRCPSSATVSVCLLARVSACIMTSL